jgi:hypothetical protein
MSTTTLPRTVTHPDWCANAGLPVVCGPHIAPTVTVEATADVAPATAETAMALTEAGTAGVYLALTDAAGGSVYVLLTPAEGWALVGALTGATRRAEAWAAAERSAA